MVKRKIEWSVEAKIDLRDTLKYYINRNKSINYSKKLNLQFNKSLNLIATNPLLGTQTDYYSVRALVTGNYQIIYEVFDQLILIVMLWDCRRNPADKRIGERIK